MLSRQFSETGRYQKDYRPVVSRPKEPDHRIPAIADNSVLEAAPYVFRCDPVKGKAKIGESLITVSPKSI